MSAMHEEPDYYVWSRKEVLPLVPPGVRKVLDVGCASGVFGYSLKEKFGAEVWGIEMSEEAAEEARAKLDHVFCGDAAEVLGDLDEKFDLVTFLDVLEHTVHPEEILASAKDRLAPGGKVLCSLPNIRYWHTFKEIVWDGDFQYRPEGVLDRTHLRFYTKKSLPRLFEAAGFQIERLEGINPTGSRMPKLLNLLSFGRLDDVRFQQFVVLAQPA